MRIAEFFETEVKQLSMTRLLCFLSFFPATYVLIKTPTSEMLLYYLGAYSTSYIGGKLSEAINKKSNG